MAENAIEQGQPRRAGVAPLVALIPCTDGLLVLGDTGPDSTPVERLLPLSEAVAGIAALARETGARWVVWSARASLGDMVSRGVHVTRTWDLAEIHRLIHGGWRADPGAVWAGVHGLDPADIPARAILRDGFSADLFDVPEGDPPPPAPGEHLSPNAFQSPNPAYATHLARAALDVARRQREQVARIDPSGRMERAAWAESAAAVLCLELERDGLPIDRQRAEELIALSAGPRPQTDADARRIRAERDHDVLQHAPGRSDVDLRNPVQVKGLLASVGIDVGSTRKWALEPYRSSSPLVDALLRWRKDERVATTYGYRWLDEHVGRDDRLRGEWSACDGAAGRMTAGNGLHNLPVHLRDAVAAAPGWTFVRADLGQIEPRVLAVVSGDPAFAAATRADDLYSPVAARLGADRSVAKIAVLAAMYGQRSGAAGQTWAALEHAYPVAMGVLDQAARAGAARAPLRTWGGRLIPLGGIVAVDEGGEGAAPAGAAAARGRYARNAIIQGSAAELFKVWAVTTREATRGLGAQIVLCLHDELIVHCPAEAAPEVARRLEAALVTAARGWARTDAVRFVADTRIVSRWSEAKD